MAEMKAEMKPILCLDFDGVLHSYVSGWQGADVISDGPVAGAQEFCQAALRHFEIVIHSSRCHQEGGVDAIEQWLRKHEFPKGIVVAYYKPSAFVTLDDRAVTFSGIWPDVQALLGFRPWMKKGV